MKRTVRDDAKVEAIGDAVVQTSRTRRGARKDNVLVSKACEIAVAPMRDDGVHARWYSDSGDRGCNGTGVKAHMSKCDWSI